MMKLTYKQASAADIPLIEDILYDVTDYFEKIGDRQWYKFDVTWEGLSRFFRIENFLLAYLEDTPVGCMAILDHDPYFWPEIPKGGSLYIHKLAIKRAFAGSGFAKEMIGYVKELSCIQGNGQVRLDCHARKEKLRRLYEQEGFIPVKEAILDDYHAAFYEWKHQTHDGQ